MAGVCSVNQVVPSIDSSGEMAGRRTSVLVIFEERVQQRDQDCEKETLLEAKDVWKSTRVNLV